MVAIITSGDISEKLDRQAFYDERPHFTMAWRKDEWKGSAPHLALLVDDYDDLQWIGRAQARRNFTTFDRLIEVVDIEELPRLALSELQGAVSTAVRRHIGEGVLPPATGRAVVAALKRIFPDYSAVFDRLSRVDPPVYFGGGSRGIRINEQRDGTGLVLELAGIGREALRSFNEGSLAQPSFFAGLADRAISEEQLIDHDVSTLPGFVRGLGAVADWKVFENGDRRLFAMNANMEPLEETLGTDVLYYNETLRSFVLVQYKRMKPEAATKELWYRPNDQFALEMSRMKAADDLYGAAADGDFRLYSNPCWLKFCDPGARLDNPVDLVKGMYISRVQLEGLLPSLKGPRGGSRIGYANVKRYLTNTQFIDLASNAWIGTRGSGTTDLETLVAEVLGNRRSLVLGVSVGR